MLSIMYFPNLVPETMCSNLSLSYTAMLVETTQLIKDYWIKKARG